jgi:hypothetical protein
VRRVPEVTINIGLSERWEAVAEGARILLEHDGADEHLIESALLLKGVLRGGALQGSSGASGAAELGVLIAGMASR